MALHEQHPPYATAIANRAILQAPAAVLLPYARAWKSSPNFRRHYLAWQILERHATEEFLPWVERRLDRVSARDAQVRFDVTTLAQIISNRFPGTEFPSLRRKFDAFTYSYGRHFIAQALAVTDPTFPTTRAFTGLWDCEADVREVAANRVSLEIAGARERLAALASDPLEPDERVAVAARGRLEEAT